mgnify:CR=1 FL=1
MNRKIRIGFLASTFTSPKLGGFSRHTINLIESLGQANPDFEFFLYFNRELAPSLLKRIPWAIPRILPLKPYLLWEQVGLPIQLSLDRIDIFHSTTNTGVPFFRPFFTAVVQTIHDTFTHDGLARIPRPISLHGLRAFFGFRVSWWAAQSADRFIAVSESTRADLAARFPGLRSKLTMVANAADPGIFPGPVNEEILARYGLAPGYILCVASGEERKNLGRLLESYRLFCDRENQKDEQAPKLVLVGNIRLSGNPDGLVQIPYCTEEVLLELYRGAAFGVAPSLAEGFGFSAVEFGAVGRAAILSEIPPYIEIAKGAAPFFPPKNTESLALWMEKLWNSPQEREEWAQKLSRAAGRFTWAEAAKKTAEIYRALCA